MDSILDKQLLISEAHLSQGIEHDEEQETDAWQFAAEGDITKKEHSRLSRASETQKKKGVIEVKGLRSALVSSVQQRTRWGVSGRSGMQRVRSRTLTFAQSACVSGKECLGGVNSMVDNPKNILGENIKS